MICVNCSQGSMGSWCPFCGTPDVVRVLGFDPLDLLNPYQFGKDIASGSSSSSSIPSIDVNNLPSIPNPYSIAYDTGKSAGQKVIDTASDAKSSIFAPVADFASTLKYIFYGGLAIGAGVFVYSVYQAWKHDIPGQALRSMSESQREGRKIAGEVLRKSA